MCTTKKNGTTIAVDAKQEVSAPLKTIADLLARIDRRIGSQEGMLHSVAARFVEFTRSVPESVELEAMYRQKAAFITHLEGGPYKQGSIKSYRLYFNRLLRRAQELGWAQPRLQIPSEWQEILNALPRSFTKKIVHFAIRSGKSPATFNEDDLKAWCKEMSEAGRSFINASNECARFRAAIVRAGLSEKIPFLKHRDRQYGVSLGAMHPHLRQEIQRLVAWKQNEIEDDRPKEAARIRPISAKRIVDMFAQLTGYVQNIESRPQVISVRELVTQVGGFTNWAKNERKVKGQSLVSGLGMVYAALRYNPVYSDVDLSSLPRILSQITVETQDAVAERKEKKYIPYDVADSIPRLIRAKKANLKHPTAHLLALYARNELLMLWILLLPWRQRNIRELRISGDNPNLINAKIRRYSTLSRPRWVAELEASDPAASFWQIRFASHETKTKQPVQMFLPAELVSLLDDYLSVHRPVLVGKQRDPGTLFVNNDGTALNMDGMRNLVKKLAFDYAGVAVNPHLYRDIVAFEWLNTHPEDFLTVSKVLWHRDINTTIRIYGRRFDESTGVARMDDWRSGRSTNTKS